MYRHTRTHTHAHAHARTHTHTHKHTPPPDLRSIDDEPALCGDGGAALQRAVVACQRFLHTAAAEGQEEGKEEGQEEGKEEKAVGKGGKRT